MSCLTGARIYKEILEEGYQDFAVKLQDIIEGTAPPIYGNPRMFFERTYFSPALKEVVEYVLRAISGKGPSIINLQTAFGGGKTHTLAVLYHIFNTPEVAKEVPELKEIFEKVGIEPVKSRVISLIGTELSPKHTLWGEIARQLGVYDKKYLVDGLSMSIREFAEQYKAPGKKILRVILEENRPVLILIDELLAYLTKLKGPRSDTLKSNTLVFLQELSETVNELSNTALVVTIPKSASRYEVYDHELASDALKVLGREQIRTIEPLTKQDVYLVARKRLFDYVDENLAKKRAEEYLRVYESLARHQYVKDEFADLEYRNKLEKSFPLHPQVVDTLFDRWAHLDNFQRTRDVLKFLSTALQIVGKSEYEDFLLLGEVPLENEKLRSIIRAYLGESGGNGGWENVIITDIIERSNKLSEEWPESGTIPLRASRTVFLLTAPLEIIKGKMQQMHASRDEIIPAVFKANELEANRYLPTLLSEVLDRLYEKLYYLYKDERGYWFRTQPKVTQIIKEYAALVEEEELYNELKEILRKRLRGVIFASSPYDVTRDTEELQYVLIFEDGELAKSILEKAGDRNREFKNSIVLLYTDLSRVLDPLRYHLAIKRIKNNKELMSQIKGTYQERLLDDEKRKYEYLLHARLVQNTKILLPTGENKFERIPIRTLSKSDIERVLQEYGKIIEPAPNFHEILLHIYKDKLGGREIPVRTLLEYFYKVNEPSVPYVKGGKTKLLKFLMRLVSEGKIFLKEPTTGEYISPDVVKSYTDSGKLSLILTLTPPKIEKAPELEVEGTSIEAPVHQEKTQTAAQASGRIAREVKKHSVPQPSPAQRKIQETVTISSRHFRKAEDFALIIATITRALNKYAKQGVRFTIYVDGLRIEIEGPEDAITRLRNELERL